MITGCVSRHYARGAKDDPSDAVGERDLLQRVRLVLAFLQVVLVDGYKG